MKKIGKRILGLLLVCAMAACMNEYVLAADNASFIQKYHVENGNLAVNVSGDLFQGAAADNFTMTFEGEELPIQNISDCAQEPVTYLCIVDISGSVHQDRFEKGRTVLNGIVSGMKQGDTMAVTTMGNSVENPVFYTYDQKADLTNVISGLQCTSNEDTLLYTALYEGIDTLSTNVSVNTKSCLILLTDGMDDHVDSYTYEEAEKKVTDGAIPVYTVTLMNDGDNADSESDRVNGRKLMDSFARMSPGGMGYNTIDQDPATIPSLIAADLASDLTLYTAFPELPSNLSSYKMEISCLMGETNYTDSIDIPSAELYPYQPTTTEPTTTTVTEDTTTTATAAPEIWEEGWFFPVIGIVLVLLILLAVIIKSNSDRKKKEQEEEAARQEKEEQERRDKKVLEKRLNALAAEAARNGANRDDWDRKQPQTAPAPEPMIPVRGGCLLHLQAIGHEEMKYSALFAPNESKKFGRAADVILNKNDNMLSRVHFRLQYADGYFRAWDEGSTHGTSVNGVVLEKNTSKMIGNGDVIGAGNFRYRVIIQKG